MLLECSIVDHCTCQRCPFPLELGIPPTFKDVFFIPVSNEDVISLFSSNKMTTLTTLTTIRTYEHASLHTKKSKKIPFKNHYTFTSIHCPLDSFRTQELFLPSFSPPPPILSSPAHLNSNKLYRVIKLINNKENPPEKELLLLSKLLKSYRNSLLSLDLPSHLLFPRLGHSDGGDGCIVPKNTDTSRATTTTNNNTDLRRLALQLSLDELMSLQIVNKDLQNILSSNLSSISLKEKHEKKKLKLDSTEHHSTFEKMVPFMRKNIPSKKEAYSAMQYFHSSNDSDPMRYFCFWFC